MSQTLPGYEKETTGAPKPGLRGAGRPLPATRTTGQTPVPAAMPAPTAPEPRFRLPSIGGPKRAKLEALVLFTREFSTLITAGVKIGKCFEIMEQQAEDPVLKAALGAILTDILAGTKLATAFERFPEVFPELMVNMVRVAELSGALDQVLLQTADYYEQEQALRSRVKSALIYPCCVLVFAFGTLYFMFTYILPTFKGIFADAHAELPLVTRLLFGFSDFLCSYGLLFPVLAVAAFFGFQAYYRTEVGRLTVDALKLRMPLFGSLNRKIVVARFSRTLSTLLNSGVNILSALEVVSGTTGNSVVSQAIRDSRAMVREGRRVSAVLAASGQFPVMVTHLLEIGEETGQTADMLDKVATFYDREVEQTLKALTSLIEPALIIVLGAIVGFIVSAVMVPMFGLISVIQK